MSQYDTLHLGLPKRFCLFQLSKVITSSLHGVLNWEVFLHLCLPFYGRGYRSVSNIVVGWSDDNNFLYVVYKSCYFAISKQYKRQVVACPGIRISHRSSSKANLLLKFANFRYRGNGGWSERNFTYTVKFADPENHAHSIGDTFYYQLTANKSSHYGPALRIIF